MKRNSLSISLILLAVTVSMAAEQPLVIKVWPGTAPGEKGDIGPEESKTDTAAAPTTRVSNVTNPTLLVFKPPKDQDTGAAALVCPGGGYGRLAFNKEGTEVAEWLNTIGVTGVVLKYRVPTRKDQPKHLAPLQDAQRAMSLVRSNSTAWGIDPQRIGVLGFSAGGHLAAALSNNYQERAYALLDDTDKTSCRPDFAVLIYPAYLLAGEKLAPEVNVTAGTPPTFLAHAYDDGIGPENSIAMFLALKKAKVPAELHVYGSGGHGFGLRSSAHNASTWPARAAEWLKSREILKKPM